MVNHGVSGTGVGQGRSRGVSRPNTTNRPTSGSSTAVVSEVSSTPETVHRTVFVRFSPVPPAETTTTILLFSL